MRILFVSDEYPPLEAGGYAQLCYDLAHGLRGRDHQVTILSSKPEAHQSIQESEPVIRSLYAPISFTSGLPIPLQQVVWEDSRRKHNLEVFKQVLRETKAQIVIFWPNLHLDTSLMFEAEKMNDLPVGYYLAGFSPIQSTPLLQYWSHPGRSKGAKMLKGLLRPLLVKDRELAPPLIMQHVMCVSEYERQRVIRQELDPDKVIVIHNGIDPAQFRFGGLPSTRRRSGELLNVLYMGRLVETKGAHTSVAAINILRQSNPEVSIHLSLLGTGDKSYMQKLERFIRLHQLEKWIEQYSWIHREQLPEFMSNYDVLVLPTVHPEPLARAVQEAMAMGLVVVATPTGGTPEIVQNDVTGLTFPPNNPSELANCLLKLYVDVSLADRLARAGYELVQSTFTMQVMIDSMEHQLEQWLYSN